MFAISALVIGFLGSFHCVAMCGPIALAITGKGENNWSYMVNRLMYNVGRVATYAVLGMLAGLAGKAFLLAGFQKSISIAVGLAMVITVIIIYFLPNVKFFNQFTIKLNKLIKDLLSSQLKKRNRLSLFFTGMANGILPCGFVYLAVAGAAITQSLMDGMIYMTMFGLGTVPAMMVVSIVGKFAGFKFRNVISKASPFLMILLGLFFIYRGIAISNESSCHHSELTIHSRNY